MKRPLKKLLAANAADPGQRRTNPVRRETAQVVRQRTPKGLRTWLRGWVV